MIGRVVIFTKVPLPGTVKTRLIPRLGAEGAASLHAALVEETLRRVETTDLPVLIALSGPLDHPWARALARRHALCAQGEGDLGDRLARHLCGTERRLALGTDCPLFEPRLLARALHDPADVVFGPAEDGGYWTVVAGGDRPDAAPIFREDPWSTQQTLSVSLHRAQAAGLTVGWLPPCYDIDDPADLDRLAADPACSPSLLPLLGPADAPRH